MQKHALSLNSNVVSANNSGKVQDESGGVALQSGVSNSEDSQPMLTSAKHKDNEHESIMAQIPSFQKSALLKCKFFSSRT